MVTADKLTALRVLLGQEFRFVAPEPIGAASMRKFALALGDRNPLFRDATYARTTPHGGLIAPPTFVCESWQYMEEILTITEIESRFASEWVLVADPETDTSLAVQRGTVLHHSKDRDEVYRKAIELHPKRFAMLYTGTMPKDTAIVL